MRLRHAIQAVFQKLGYVIVRREHFIDPVAMHRSDGLETCHNRDFANELDFMRAYARGLQAADGIDPGHHWRVAIALWAARLAARVEGDFVECGVNAGFISSAIMGSLDWNRSGRRFFLVDSFEGPRMEQFTEHEHASGFVARIEDAVRRDAYVTDFERVQRNFAEWPSAVIVKGWVPEALSKVDATQVAFLHLDLNAAQPERDAFAHFWPRLPAGGVVLLDDYAFYGCEAQKAAIDKLADELGFFVLSLPTGQGLVVKGV